MGAVAYQFPVSMGDTVYITYAGRIYPCEVTGFQVSEHGEYVFVRYPDVNMEQLVLMPHICLTQEEAEKKIKEKKEE